MSQTSTVEAARATAPRDLEPLFAPRSIAVVGASRTPGSVGHAITRNLIYGGFTGVVYPINPKAKSILGCRCTPRLSQIGEEVDLAVLVVPAGAVEDVVREAAEHGTKHFVVITAGFKEIGGEGVERERRLKALAQERGLSILGPNCLGVINTAPHVCMNATFAREMPAAGNLGLISQSGALCTALLDYAKGIGMGFSRFISFGNKVDISEIDLLRSLASDPQTNVILMYIEELSAGQAFVEAVNQITHGPKPKPVLAIKTGRTAQGAAAAASHTGSLAGSDEVYEAIMSQAGVIRVESVKELFDYAEVFGDAALPRGRRTAVVTNAGGPGIMATDACIRNGMELTKFQEYTVKSLRFQLPPTASLKNPVDVIGDAKSDRYRAALDAVTADEGTEQVVVIVTPQMMTDLAQIAHVVGEIRGYCGKPVVACLMGLADIAEAVTVLKRHGVPTFTFPEDAMRALAAKSRYAEWVRAPMQPYQQFDCRREAVERLFAAELDAGRTRLVELQALEALGHYGFPLVPYRLARTADEAAEASEQMGYPVVMKISGPKILHKTDVGGVRLNLRDAEAVRQAYNGMIASVQAKLGKDIEIWGVLVQKMLPPGKEIILGMTRDPRFGPLLMFGLGGIYTEALRDVSFRLAPIRGGMAGEMIRGIRSYRLLEGVRGEAPSDLPAIADCLGRLSQLVTDLPQIKELDINPLIVYAEGTGAVVADARIILSE
ncbi:MAG TPA: acetate--CoA ligase family protein [Phycisphaerae bacterium]|nr:acetate--CoA ligase family protein [Phycisphaerae bacterium]HNU44686.1 acetate--CoA ligase family protein [Phycisphaerae bacterium]